jgi:hypothetical protein
MARSSEPAIFYDVTEQELADRLLPTVLDRELELRNRIYAGECDELEPDGPRAAAVTAMQQIDEVIQEYRRRIPEPAQLKALKVFPTTGEKVQ